MVQPRVFSFFLFELTSHFMKQRGRLVVVALAMPQLGQIESGGNGSRGKGMTMMHVGPSIGCRAKLA